MSEKMRAYFCWIPLLGGNRERGEGGVFLAESRGKARYLCYLAVRDVFPSITFADIRCVREPGFDGMSPRFNGCMPRHVPDR